MHCDLSLDIIRGWLELTIFASLVLGSWIGTWLILAPGGLTDSYEQFVFVFVLTLGSLFDNKQSQPVWWATAARSGC